MHTFLGIPQLQIKNSSALVRIGRRDVRGLRKAEMNLEANLNLTLSKVLEEGKTLVPVFGPGLTGMENLGNSCYMNSVV